MVDYPRGAAPCCWPCQQSEVQIGYLRGLALARTRDFYRDGNKTDAKDALVHSDVVLAHFPTGGVGWRQADGLPHLELLFGDNAYLCGTLIVCPIVSAGQAFERALDSRGLLAVFQQYPSGPVTGAGVRYRDAALQVGRWPAVQPTQWPAGRILVPAVIGTVQGNVTSRMRVARLAGRRIRSYGAATSCSRNPVERCSGAVRRTTCAVFSQLRLDKHYERALVATQRIGSRVLGAEPTWTQTVSGASRTCSKSAVVEGSGSTSNSARRIACTVR
jgi:hypothetical protein